MRFIHTADLHLGNKMHDVDREEEYRELFQWLKETIVEQKADALVIAGDIYDTIQPPVTARKSLNQFLASLLDTDCRNVIIVGGNHDSAALLDANKELLEELNIHIVGSISNREISDLIFKIHNKNGEVVGICAAIPYTKELDLKRFESEDVNSDDITSEDENYADMTYRCLYQQALEEAKRVRGDLQVPIITTGHLHAADLQGRYSEEELSVRPDDGVRNFDVVGNLGCVHVSAFPEEYDYIALGHIHYHTRVARNSKIRYSGSPVVMGFDETEIPRYVLCVDCEYDKPAVVDKLEITSNYQYKRFEGDCETLEEALQDLVANTPDEVQMFVELRYKAEDSFLVNNMLNEFVLPENISVVSTKVLRRSIMNSISMGSRTMREMQELDPEEIFENLILSHTEAELSEEEKVAKTEKYMQIFMNAYNQVLKGGRHED